MKILIYITIFMFGLCTSHHTLYGQFSKNDQNHSYNLKTAFLNAFNHGKIEDFRSFFGYEMKKRNSFKKLKTSFNQIESQIGAIRSLSLDTIVENSYSYMSFHEKMITLKVVFEVDDDGRIDKMLVDSNYIHKNAVTLERNLSELILPFHGEWYVFWGGKKKSDNYHNAYDYMKGAFDFWVMGSNGKSHRNNAIRNEDFYAFGKGIIAPVDAKVIYTFDEVEDNIWPAMNSKAGFGNLVLLETKHKEYLLFAHLKYKSVKVKNGQHIRKGEILGNCGNSGNSTEPHLHFQMQNIPDLSSGKGIWVHLKKIKVNGKIMEDYIPVRKDKISN